jgi:hypothetical protein
MKWQTDAKERIMSHSDEVISTSYTTREGTKGCQKHSQDVRELGSMQLHATSQQTVIDEDELRHRRIAKRMAIEEKDERFIYVIRPLQRRLRDLGPDPGYTTENWMACLRNLALPLVYRGKDSIQETLRRSEPPQELDQASWTKFVEGLMEELNTVLREAIITPEKKRQTSSFVDHYKKEPERVTKGTLVEQKVTRTYVERWDGLGAWQTVQRRTYTFVDTTRKVPKVDGQNDNERRCPEDQVVQIGSCIGKPQRPHSGNSPNGLHSSTQQTLGFVNKTDLENNETCCLSEKNLLTRSEERNYTNNGQITGLLPHQSTFGSSIQTINNRSSNTNIKPGENSSIGPQTAVPSSQLQSSIMDDENGQQKVQRDVRVVKQRGQRHHRDVIHESCSFTNDKANEGKNVSNRQTAHSTPSQIHEEGHVPMTKHPTRPRTRIEVSNGPQMAIPLIQTQSSDERSTPMSKGSRRCHSDGERRRRRGDAVYENRLFMSDEHTRQAEDPSGLDEEQGTGDVHAIRQAKHSRRHRGASRNHQTDMDLSQVQLSIKTNAPENGETRRRHGDVVHGGQPKTNDKHGERLTNASGRAVVVSREGRNDVCMSYGDSKNLMEEKVSKQLMTHRTSFRKQGGDHVPVAQLPMRSRTRNEFLSGPKTAVSSSQPQSSRGSSNPMYGGPRGRPGDARYGGQTKSNDEKVVNGRWTAYITPSMTNRSGGAIVTQGSMRSKTRNGYLYDPQTAVLSSQPQPSRGSSNPRYGESRGRPGDAQYGERTRINDENSRIPKEVVNGRWTACCTPSLTNETGYLPVPQRPTRSTTRKEDPSGPQTTADSPQRELMSGERIQRLGEAWGGLHSQHGSGAGNGRRSKSNVKHKKRLTSLSVNVQERSTVTYLLGRKPKAPDKHARRVDNKYNLKAHNAPRPTERDCVEQSLKQQDVFGRQRSLCDSRHTSHDTMCERVAERGVMECAHPTYPTHQVHGPYWDQDSDDSLSSESGVGNEGPKWRAKNNTEQLSECSDELSEARSEIREPDEELTGPQPETVHMACMRDHHHYTVYRDMNDGEGPSQNDISDNGIYRDNDGIHWAYEEEFVECSDPSGCGSPVENHWENGEPAEWLENVDLERYSKEEESDDQEDEPTDESDDQEDEPTDESDDQEDEPTDESDDQDDEPTDESEEY